MIGRKEKERERPYLRDPDDPEYIKELQRPAVIKVSDWVSWKLGKNREGIYPGE